MIDPRMERLYAVLEAMASGDRSVRCEVSSKRDEVDAIAYSINVLAEELDAADSARAEAEHHANLARQRLEQLMQVAPTITYACSAAPPYRVAYVSGNALTILGFRPDEFVADPGLWARRVHPADLAVVRASIGRLFERGTQSREYRWQVSDGSWRWIHDQVRVVRDADGSALEMIGSWLDISDRRTIENLGHAREERLRALVQAIPDLVLRVAPDGTVLDAQLPEGWPIPAEVPIEGKSVLEMVPKRDAQRTIAVLAEARAKPGHVVPLELEVKRPTSRWFEARIVASYSANELVITVRDVTTWKNQETAMQYARSRAEAANKAKSLFLANMSHELRTPLNSIIGFSEMLETQHFGSLNERQLEYTRQVIDAGRHLLTLINDVLDLSRIEADRMDLSRGWSELPALCESVVASVRPLAQKKQIALACVVADDLPTFWFDPTRIRQVLFNLLSNAIKFTPAHGKVGLAARRDDSGIVIDVHDTGIGIKQEDVPRLFQAFERLDSNAEGTGLGLALSRRLVEMHGGNLSVRSIVGQGSVFTVALPRQGPPIRRVSSMTLSSPVSREPLALVIDDDASAADLIAGELRASGLAVAVATDGAQALLLADSLRPEAITLDVLLPGVDGWELLLRFRENPHTARTPIVVVSVVDDRERAMVLGADEFLLKPAPIGSVREALRRVGVKLVRLDGVRIGLCATGNDTLERLEGELRRAGCVVKRGELGCDLAMKDFAPQVALVDLTIDPALGARTIELLGSLTPRPHIIALIERLAPGRASSVGLPYDELLASVAVHAPEVLVRKLHAVVSVAVVHEVS